MWRACTSSSPEILDHLLLDERHALLEGGIVVDLVLPTVLDDELAVHDAVEQRRKNRLQGHVAILRRQRLLGDFEFREMDGLPIDGRHDRILEHRRRRRRRRSRQHRLGHGAGLQARGLGGRRRALSHGWTEACESCAAQDDDAQEAQTTAHEILRGRNPTTDGRRPRLHSGHRFKQALPRYGAAMTPN
jgi:hypothetical protein